MVSHYINHAKLQLLTNVVLKQALKYFLTVQNICKTSLTVDAEAGMTVHSQH